MTCHIARSILLLHKLKLGRNNAPLMPHSHQRLCPYVLYKYTYVASLLVFPWGDWLYLQRRQWWTGEELSL